MENSVQKNKAIFQMEVSKLAIEGICNKKDVSQEIKEKYDNGMSAENQFFGQSFAKSCAEQASRLASNKELSLNDAAFQLFRCTRILHDSEFAIGLNHFVTQLKEKAPDFFDDNNKFKPEFAEELKRVMSGGLKVVNKTQP